MIQTKKTNYGKDVVEPLVCKALNLKSTGESQIGIDGIHRETNETYEFKWVSGENRPSFTRLPVNPSKSLHQNITDRMFSQKYVIVCTEEHFNKYFNDFEGDIKIVDGHYLLQYNKTSFRKWVLNKLELDTNSRTKKTQFRINKCGRSKHQDAKLREFFK